MINLTYGKECKTVVFINSGHSLLLAENAMEVKKILWENNNWKVLRNM